MTYWRGPNSGAPPAPTGARPIRWLPPAGPERETRCCYYVKNKGGLIRQDAPYPSHKLNMLLIDSPVCARIWCFTYNFGKIGA